MGGPVKVGVYALCGNDLKKLGPWVYSARQADYICLLDTGSTDGTWRVLSALGTEPASYVEPLSRIIVRRDDSSEGDKVAAAREMVPRDARVCIRGDVSKPFPDGWRQAYIQLAAM